MKSIFGVLLMAASAFAANTVHEFTMPAIDGKPAPLAAYKGKVMLIVNVASRCGYTPQYTGLEALYRKYKNKGLVVVGFPANNFGAQEPGTNEEIKEFCTRKYDVTFPMYSKVSVKGGDQAPLYAFLTQAGGDVKWNFTKFLVGKDGKVIKKFDSGVAPESPELVSAVETALK
ncbi:MAG: glutathione peroxidase [Bryobacteraceae bacterium]|nr:glutathione peroxidase [Bryobacteraceae bacterium]